MNPVLTLSPPGRRQLCAAALAGGLLGLQPGRLGAAPADYSAAERALFMSPHLAGLPLPSTLHYAFRKAGSAEPGFEDQVNVLVSAGRGGACCRARAEFLSGSRRQAMPEVEAAQGNPVLMYFLEHDVREMQRLTAGSADHFRRRIRLALAAVSTLVDLKLSYLGQAIGGQEVQVSPYLDDPNRPRFERYARKAYRFLLSDSIPGGVFGVRTRVDGPGQDLAPLIVEELTIAGGQILSPSPAARGVQTSTLQ